MMSWNGSWTWGSWVAMSLMMIIFWTFVVVAAVLLLRRYRAPHGRVTDVDAQQILDQRLARGDISEEEYRRRSDLLRAQQPGSSP